MCSAGTVRRSLLVPPPSVVVECAAGKADVSLARAVRLLQRYTLATQMGTSAVTASVGDLIYQSQFEGKRLSEVEVRSLSLSPLSLRATVQS